MSASSRDVYVAGVGLHPFGRFPDLSTKGMAKVAISQALADAGVPFKDIQAGYFSQVYRDMTTPGQAVLADLGLTGIPIMNIENACASGSSALWQAHRMVSLGAYDVVLVFGSEKVPRGPVSVTSESSPERLLGVDHMMAEYALRMQRYMSEYSAPAEAFARVSVKAHENAVHNRYAQ